MKFLTTCFFNFALEAELCIFDIIKRTKLVRCNQVTFVNSDIKFHFLSAGLPVGCVFLYTLAL